MATGVQPWSTTAATNATADTAVNWAEGQAPSSVNDSARAMMASVAKWRNDISGTVTTGGSSTAFTITSNQNFATAAAMSGALICFIPATTSGASPTLSVDGLTARQIRSSTGVNVPTGALIIGTPYLVTYIHASTEFILVGFINTFGNLIATGTLSVTGAATLAAVSGTTGTFSGAVSGTTGTFSGAVSGTTGTFSAAVSGTTGTFSGALSGATASGAMVATQAQQETGSATDALVTPGRQQFHASAAKAWVTWTSTASIGASYNVSSVSDVNVGRWGVNFSTSFSSAAYCAVGMGSASAGLQSMVQDSGTTPVAGAMALLMFASSNALVDPNDKAYAVFYGDQ